MSRLVATLLCLPVLALAQPAEAGGCGGQSCHGDSTGSFGSYGSGYGGGGYGGNFGHDLDAGLTRVPVGQPLQATGVAFGDVLGLVRLETADRVHECPIRSWTSRLVEFEVPSLAITRDTPARLSLLHVDGRVIRRMSVVLTPAPAASPAAPSRPAPVVPTPAAPAVPPTPQLSPVSAPAVASDAPAADTAAGKSTAKTQPASAPAVADLDL